MYLLHSAGNPCTDNTCENGATCSLVNNVQQCECPFGFYGDVSDKPALNLLVFIFLFAYTR